MFDRDQVLLQKTIFCIAYLGLGYGFARLPVTARWSGARLDRAATLALVVSRLVVFGVVYFALGFAPRSDVVMYFRESRIFLREFPHWFFSHAYGPAFLAVTSLALRIAHDPKTLVVLAILFEAAGFYLWLRVARRGFPESTVRLAALAYLANPFGAFHVAVLGQNRVWLSPFLAGAVWLAGHRPFRSGLAFGLSFVFVSFFPLPLIPFFLLASPRPAAWLGGAVLPMGVACALSPRLIETLVGQWRFHSGGLSSGNLVFLLTATGADFGPAAALSIGLLAAVLLVAPWVKHYRGLRGADGERTLIYAIGAAALIVLICSPKSFPGYLMPVFFILALAAARLAGEGNVRPAWKIWAPWAIFGTLASLESSLWFAWLKRMDFRMLVPGLAMTPRPWPQLVPGKAWAVLGLELALLALYGLFLSWLWRLYKRPAVG